MSFFFTEISDGSSSSSFAYTTSESFFSSSGGEATVYSKSLHFASRTSSVSPVLFTSQ